eukprot:scaffold340690_cov34-Prasinocladus_malaysianus.AAC.1
MPPSSENTISSCQSICQYFDPDKESIQCATGADYKFSVVCLQLSKIMRFIVTANLVGYPAMSVPAGYDDRQMPVGLQLMGQPWGEATLMACAHYLEMRLPRPQKPQVALGVLSRAMSL